MDKKVIDIGGIGNSVLDRVKGAIRSTIKGAQDTSHVLKTLFNRNAKVFRLVPYVVSSSTRFDIDHMESILFDESHNGSILSGLEALNAEFGKLFDSDNLSSLALVRPEFREGFKRANDSHAEFYRMGNVSSPYVYPYEIYLATRVQRDPQLKDIHTFMAKLDEEVAASLDEKTLPITVYLLSHFYSEGRLSESKTFNALLNLDTLNRLLSTDYEIQYYPTLWYRSIFLMIYEHLVTANDASDDNPLIKAMSEFMVKDGLPIHASIRDESSFSYRLLLMSSNIADFIHKMSGQGQKTDSPLLISELRRIVDMVQAIRRDHGSLEAVMESIVTDMHDILAVKREYTILEQNAKGAFHIWRRFPDVIETRVLMGCGEAGNIKALVTKQYAS